MDRLGIESVMLGRAHQKPYKILFAGMAEDVKSRLTAAFSEEAFHIEWCAVDQTLVAVENNIPDLLVFDASPVWPDHAVTLLSSIHASYPPDRLPILLILGRTDEDRLSDRRMSMVSDFIFESFDLKELSVRIRFQVQRHRIDSDIRKNTPPANTELLFSIFDNSPECIKIVSKTGNILDINKAGLEMMGFHSTKETIGKSVYDMISPEFKQDYRVFHEGVCCGESGFMRYQVITEVGVPCWIESHGVPMKYPITGETVQLAIDRDITQQKGAEEALDASRRKLGLHLQQNMFAIIEWDTDFKVAEWNPAAETIFGYTREEALGQSANDLIIPDKIQSEIHDVWGKLLKLKGGNYKTNTNRTKDGREIFCEWFNTPLATEDGEIIGVLSLAQDITQRKRAEDALQEMNVELEHRVQERTAMLEITNKELEAFSYSISHDLRAPLRHINGFLKLLVAREKNRFDDKSTQFINHILNATHRMNQLIEDLLALSRIGRSELKRVSVDLTELVQQIQKELAIETTDRQITWRIDTLGTIEADPGLIRVLMMNLISNSVKYTQMTPQANIHVGCISNNTGGEQGVFYFVRDNGIGFNPLYVEKLFGVFQRLHSNEVYEGTGIGLAIAKRIVNRHGGEIWAESEADRGATFYFTLPPSGKTTTHRI